MNTTNVAFLNAITVSESYVESGHIRVLVSSSESNVEAFGLEHQVSAQMTLVKG